MVMFGKVEINKVEINKKGGDRHETVEIDMWTGGWNNNLGGGDNRETIMNNIQPYRLLVYRSRFKCQVVLF